jgi:CubicO group peptidase (beta-lactamase class C family)
MRRLCLFSLFFFCCHGINTESAYGQERTPLASLNDYLEFKVQRDHIPGLAACIIKDDSVIWSRGVGYQNIEERIPMTPQTVIGTASISKIVTALAVMQLRERKKLDLHDPVNKYLPFKVLHPEYPDVDITVAQLLSHTSSISNGPSLWRSYSCDEQPLTLGEWARAYFTPGGRYYHKEGNFSRKKPGKGFLYSNAGYALLSYLVEIVSGMHFNEYCVRNIFAPLRLENTSFDVGDIENGTLATMYSYGYNMDLERDLMQPMTDCGKAIRGDYLFPLCNYTAPTIGAGGMYSSTEQLSHLLIALMNDGTYKGSVVLSKASIAEMLSPYVDPSLLPGQFASFGLGGYAMRLARGEPVWGHTGADPGMSTLMLFNPETKIGAIVLASRFVDIRDLIEWLLAEGIAEYADVDLSREKGAWKQYARNQVQHTVTFRVVPNYLPGGSHIHIIGNHRYLGSWVGTGIPMAPQRDRSWETVYSFPDSTSLEFKITRGDMGKEAVTMDGKVLPNHSLVVVRDTVVNIVVEDWKDQAQQ